MPKEIYRCNPCNYEYEHLYFSAAPRSAQQIIPPCPLCGKDLTCKNQELVEEQPYQCWESEGGCGAEICTLTNIGVIPDPTIICPYCGHLAKLNFNGFAISHGKCMTKGASLDVVIGRDADQRWTNIYDRKSVRDKVRKASGTHALSLIGKDEYTPINGGRLTSVEVPENKVNVD